MMPWRKSIGKIYKSGKSKIISNKAGKKKISIKFKKVTGAKVYGSYSAKVKKLNKNLNE